MLYSRFFVETAIKSFGFHDKKDKKMIRLHDKWKSYNVFNYVCLYCGIVFLIAAIMGGCAYYFMYKTVYGDCLFSNRQHLSSIANQHETNMQIMDNIVLQVGVEDTYTRFRLEEAPIKTIALKERLQSYNTISHFYDLLLYYYHDDEYLYNYMTSTKVEDFLKWGLSVEQMTAEEFMGLLEEETPELRILPEQKMSGDWIRFYAGSRKAYTAFFQVTQPYMQDTLMFLVPDTYYDSLLKDEDFRTCTTFLYYAGRIIVARGTEQVTMETLEKMFEQNEIDQMLEESQNGQEQVQIGGKKYLFSLEKGTSGIYYGMLQPKEVFWDKLKIEQWVLLFVLLACIFPTSLIILYVSRGMVGKVKRMSELLQEDNLYDLTGIENGIQTLVATHRETEKDSKVLKKNRLINRFVRGEFPTREEFVEEANKAALNLDKAFYILVLFKNLGSSNKKEEAVLLDMLAQEKDVEGHGIHLVNNNKLLFALFSDEPESIENVLEKLKQSVNELCDEYVMAVSEFHEEFLESNRAYLEVDTAFDNYLLFGNDKLIRFGDVAHREYVNLVPDNYLQRLRYAIRAGDKAVVEMVIRDICNKINRENASLYAFRIFCDDIIRVLLSEYKGNDAQVGDLYNVFMLSKCLNMQDFNDLLKKVCETIIDKRMAVAVGKSDVVQKALEYMEQNYQKSEMTMNTLADHLGISLSLLSVEFKKETNMSPSNYLANLRVEKAKELLKNTDLLIKEISLAVGYEDLHVLNRWFKKYTGMTPGQYREKA